MEESLVVKPQKHKLAMASHAKKIVSSAHGPNGLIAPKIAMEELASVRSLWQHQLRVKESAQALGTRIGCSTNNAT